jgi:hypothetical protein
MKENGPVTAARAALLEPLYAAAAELDLAVVLHTFTVLPPYAPVGRIPGIIYGCSAPPRTPGVACAIWRQ